MRVRVQRVDPGTALGIGCVVHGGIGLCSGLPAALVLSGILTETGQILGLRSEAGLGMIVLGLWFGWWVGSTIFGALTWALVSVLYNIGAALMGGIAVELERPAFPAPLPPVDVQRLDESRYDVPEQIEQPQYWESR